MHNYPMLLLLGLGVGVLGTLVGAGGGFILVPVLLLLDPNEDADTLTSISLCVVFFNALAGSHAYARMKRIDYRSGILFALAAIPGSILGAFSTTLMPRHAFNIVAGLMLIAGASLLLLFPGEYRAVAEVAENPHVSPDPPEPRVGPRRRYLLGMALSALVGYASTLLGMGGGIIHVPIMVKVLSFPVHTATATSHFVLALVALTGTLTHVASGAFHHGVRRAAVLSIGAVIGAPLGAKLSARLAPKRIVQALAVALAVAGVRVILLAL